ncbi:MAG: PKD domain-containing protein, partial [Bacteroidota bacterium]
LTQTTTYRAVVKSGVCPEENSEQGVITVYPLPDVNFMADSVCRGQASTFTNQSSITVGSIINYSWDFGNGQSSNSQHPGYTYPTNGIYTVQLTATSNQGCIDSSFQIVKIYSTPVVGFSVQNACHNIPVNFTNNSYSPTGDNLQFYWDFGDATGFSTDTNPSYIYTMPGTYDVKLVTQSITTGCSDSVIYAATTYPRAVPGFMTENECDGSTADFYNNTTLTSGITNYYWTFGDGAFSIDINPSHLYGTSGNYIVLLQASTDKGCVDTISHTIYIHPVPTAAFNFDDICYTDTVHFTDLSTIDSGSISWLWNFGNGNTSADQNPDYYYSSPGTYLVNLQVVSDSGCVSQIYENIEVFSLPNVNFNFSNSCLSDSVSFNNLTTIQSGNLNYLWDFGNGSTSALKNPVMLFGNAGLYDVQLIAWSGLSCSDSVTKTLQIYPDPVAEFSANNVCDGIPVSFINNSTIESGSVQSYSWDFGDGTNSIQPEPEKLYLNPGSYTVNLDIVSNNGCTGHVQHDITVDYLPLANFNIYNVCHNTPISPDNLSTITSGTLTYKWSFGDTDTSIVPEPNHIYASPGLYPVTLKAYSENSCVDSLIRYVEIFSLPNANAGSDTTISKGQTTMLSGSGGSIYYWFPSTGLSSPARSNPIASPVQTINYVLQVEDYNGCISYDTVKVTVLDDYNITASNIITPDGNGYNDTWNIQNIENYADAEVFIYDKWGNEVFHSNAYQNQWDGKNANGDMLPDGAYFYIIRFADSDIIYKGALTILRNK